MTVKYTPGYFKMFIVCLIVHNNTLTMTFLFYFSTCIGNLYKMNSLKWLFCSLVCQILLGPIMGLLKITQKKILQKKILQCK